MLFIYSLTAAGLARAASEDELESQLCWYIEYLWNEGEAGILPATRCPVSSLSFAAAGASWLRGNSLPHEAG